MSSQPAVKKLRETTSLIFLEGDTEVEFFAKLFPRYLGRNVPRSVKNLHGTYNILNKVLDKTAHHISKHSSLLLRVYCFLDRENVYHNPPIDIEVLRNTFSSERMFNSRIISVDIIMATQMIESWFFYDLDGIYRFLSVPRADRNPRKYMPPEKFTANDLYRLFARYNKIYIKGRRCANFIDNLDIEKIYRECRELNEAINLIITNASRDLP